ncbi:Acetyltransferase (GNAT) family protein [compost metagenome]
MARLFVSDLSTEAVPPSNPHYEAYSFALPCEVGMYLQRIGQNPDAPVEAILAFDDSTPDKVVGFLVYLPIPTNPEACGVCYMAVLQSHRRHGIGSAMMREAMARYSYVELTCPIKKVAFYEQLGFQVIDAEGTQVVMNTRAGSSPELMGLVNAAEIWGSPQMAQIHEQLVQRWGRKELAKGEKQLRRQVEQLERQAASYVRERLAEH